jgi:hypothetical protein
MSILKNYNPIRSYLLKLARKKKNTWSKKVASMILCFSIKKHGVWFYRKGDEVMWVFPWKRKEPNQVFLSMAFTGTGHFGDAYFPTLKSIDETWNDFFEHCQKAEDSKESFDFLKKSVDVD